LGKREDAERLIRVDTVAQYSWEVDNDRLVDEFLEYSYNQEGKESFDEKKVLEAYSDMKEMDTETLAEKHGDFFKWALDRHQPEYNPGGKRTYQIKETTLS
jgi:hypothetical protein